MQTPNQNLIGAIARLAVLTGFLAAPAVAEQIECGMTGSSSLADRLLASQLVFEGTVVAVDHRNSSPEENGDRPIPHAFVTFHIERAIKGESAEGSRITLRFIGGPNGEGLTLQVSGVPRFNVGDRDVLFVRDNLKDECPLVGWSQGRLRVVRGEVYDDLGCEIWLTPDGRLVSGERSIDVSVTGAPQADVDPKAGESIAERLPLGSMRPAAAGLHALLQEAQVAASMLKDARGAAPVPSANIGQTFTYRMPRPATAARQP